MKVQGSSTTSTLMTEYAFKKEQNENQTVWKQEDEWGQPVQVTFSEEGIESLRKKVVEIEGEQTFTDFEKMKDIWSKSVIDLEGTYSMEMISAVRKAKSEEKNQTEDESIKDKYYKTAYNYLEYYANKYDEIVKGYEDGTREFWVADQNSELGYRKVTKEDEIAALDKVYERNAEIQATFAIMEPIGRKAIHDSMVELGNIRKDKKNNTEYVEEEPIEKLYERMMESRNIFKNRYSTTATQGEENQNLTKLIDDIFKSQFSW